ncbi:MAG: bifunctional 2-polyprenyl-6-hydroxyphenol methylase/3-demethylubiquinol 3-O-methyltransferase UbiG [Burkholderiales bacterium]
MQHDLTEINKFNDLAHEWWNLDGEFRTLHHINPVRLGFIKQHVSLQGKLTLDVGCGGGILAESLAQSGAIVSGIDLAPQSIEVAKLHLYESGLSVNYECIDIAVKASQEEAKFEVLTCMEMLEHVPDPEEIIANCAKLVMPGGMAFFSTLNRTLKSYALAVLAAEYILKLIPKGTHDYKKFIKPSELRYLLVKHGFELVDIKGLQYNPLTKQATLTNDISINYIISCHKVS